MHQCQYIDSLPVGRSGDRTLVGGETFRARPDQPQAPPSLLYSGPQVFARRVKRSRRGVDHPPHLAPTFTFTPPLGPSWLVLG